MNKPKQPDRKNNYLLENNCRVVILSHFGRIKSEEDKAKNSLKIVAKELANLLGKNVKFADIAIFSLGLKVKGGAPTKENYNVGKYILGLKLRARATGELKTENLDTSIKLINLAAPATENPGNPGNPGNPDDTGKDNPSGGGSQTTGGGGNTDNTQQGGGGTTDSGSTDEGGGDNVNL